MDHWPDSFNAGPTDIHRGELLNVYSQGVAEICMGLLCFKHMFTGSDTVDEELIGEDILLCDPSSPVDILGLKENNFLVLPHHCKVS